MLILLMLTASKLWAQAGPPFQTDDPTPVDLGHYEFYVFGTVDGTQPNLTPLARIRIQLGGHPQYPASCYPPFGAVLPSNNPAYAPGGTGASAFGLTDMELGVKYGFIKQTAHRPRLAVSPCLRFLPAVTPKASASAVCGTSCNLGRKGVRTLEPRRRSGIHRRPANPVSQLSLWRISRQEGSRQEAGTLCRGLFTRPRRLRCRSNTILDAD